MTRQEVIAIAETVSPEAVEAVKLAFAGEAPIVCVTRTANLRNLVNLVKAQEDAEAFKGTEDEEYFNELLNHAKTLV